MSRVPVPVQGWDSVTELVGEDGSDDVWVERAPRRPDVRAALEHETRLLPLLAPRLPLEVPVPVPVPPDDDGPWRVRHLLVPGEPGDAATLTARDGRRVGVFLRALHRTPRETYERAGTTPRADPAGVLEGLSAAVLHRLPADLVGPAEALLARAAVPVPRVLVHGDLGPAHLLRDGVVSGVIDWTDARLDDPAVDLAWVLHGAPPEFAAGVQERYGPTDAALARSRDHHALGPWHEVAHGAATGQEAYVGSGLQGVVTRLRWLG